MMRTRRAVSIAELLVVMSAFSVILTMSAALIHRAMRTQSDSRAFYDAERSAARLARQFRDDVHNATAASVDSGDLGENVMLRLQFPDGRTVEYSHSNGGVLRISQEGGVSSRDEFVLRSPIELDVRNEESPPRIVVTLAAKRREAVRADAMSADLHVEATLNRALYQGQTQ